ncbi:pyridoxal phosphate-dependent transferase [Syncephalis pseudoplumigaleata]|uniref:histidinol-phosphate transaminase n=1 Tax=Syncephalis pseudoplumigaleata TaxID=1712513 RepID=A0A4P9YVL4_9FUNG|nr:pyridoxal phosphate-dependent transferase [Syncephalis pseudoplumigaleata]|eukprot:RKP23934.1 pyridoxal phosphate-dependent transferase [Syncephalis pseudoplumigaleata]
MKGEFLVDDLVRPNIRTLTPYRCARDDYNTGILLDANENAYGPAALPPPPPGSNNSSGEAASADGCARYHRYPDPLNLDVKAMYTAWRGLPGPEWAFFGVGSDEAIDIIMRVFGVPGRYKILICPPTYGMYSVSAATNDLGVVKVPLDVTAGRFQLRVDEILAATANDDDIRMMFLCSPGNPTGVRLDPRDVRRILESDYRGLVIIDEAYIDFVEAAASASADDSATEDAKGSLAQWTMRYPNLIVMQTLSKSFGLAAIRLGVALASPRTIHWLNVIKAPYNIPAPTIALAKQALSPEGIERMRGVVQQLLTERKRLTETLRTLPGVLRVMGHTDANFVLCVIRGRGTNMPDSLRAARIYQWMADEGVVVRYRGHEPGCEGCLRITVGTSAETDATIAKLAEALANPSL